jgi:serine protease AprX
MRQKRDIPGVGIRALVVGAALALLAPISAQARPAPPAPHAHVSPALARQAADHPDTNFAVIVQGRPGATPAGVTASVGKVRAGRKEPAGAGVHAQLATIAGVAATLDGEEIQALADDPAVRAITPDLPVAGTRGPATSAAYSNDQTWSDDAGVTPLWNLVDTAKLPTIAIVDSGVDPGPISKNLLAQTVLYSGGGQNSKFDGFGHGTMVAGIASLSLAHHAGAAPGANIVSLDVLDDDGMGTESDVIAAADWILQNKSAYDIKVANFSLSTSAGSSLLYDPLDQAVEKLWLAGVTVVAAAGNYGTADGPSGVTTAPGNDPFVITVGAADTGATANAADDFRAPWSAYGYTPDGFLKPELGAPGRMLNGPVPGNAKLVQEFPDRKAGRGYMWMSGTSFAAPIVSGTAADLIALHPSWTPDQIKGALMVSARAYADPSAQFPLGVGIVNGAGAAAVLAPPNPNTALEAFVGVDPATGLPVFNSAAWGSAASGDAAWGSAAWGSAAWGSAAWGSAAWGSAAWGSAAWSSAAWGSAAWGSAAWGSAVSSNRNPDR